MKIRRPIHLALLAMSLVVIVGSIALVAVIATQRSTPGPVVGPGGELAFDEDAIAGGDLPVMWDAPTFSFPDQNGQQLTNKDLIGHVWIADFIFTQCTSICPTMTAKMVLLHHQLNNPALRFVSFSVDPEHDTPVALKTYSEKWNASESRWHLLRTQPDTLQAIAQGMKVLVQATNDQANPIAHSNLFFLIDQNGHVRGVYNSGDRETMDRLAEHARQLSSGAGANSAGSGQSILASARSGRELFSTLGCAACHDNVHLAPPLAHLSGRTIALEGGATVPADDAYLRQSIIDPFAQIVAGYGKTMPDYQGYINASQVDALVSYLHTLGPDPAVAAAMNAAPATAMTRVTDPVCKMQISVDATSLHVDHAGKTYYFCSQDCADKFKSNPNQYTTPATTQPK